AGPQDVPVSGGHVELDRLAGPYELELGDALALHYLPVTAAGPPEVVQGPLQRHFGFLVAVGFVVDCPEESRVTGAARTQVAGGDTVLPQQIDLRQEGGKGHLLLAPHPFDGGTGRP